MVQPLFSQKDTVPRVGGPGVTLQAMSQALTTFLAQGPGVRLGELMLPLVFLALRTLACGL